MRAGLGGAWEEPGFCRGPRSPQDQCTGHRGSRLTSRHQDEPPGGTGPSGTSPRGHRAAILRPRHPVTWGRGGRGGTRPTRPGSPPGCERVHRPRCSQFAVDSVGAFVRGALLTLAGNGGPRPKSHALSSSCCSLFHFFPSCRTSPAVILQISRSLIPTWGRE